MSRKQPKRRLADLREGRLTFIEQPIQDWMVEAFGQETALGIAMFGASSVEILSPDGQLETVVKWADDDTIPDEGFELTQSVEG